MCVALIGGMDRLKRDYQRIGGKYGAEIRHFEKRCPYLEQKLLSVDAIIVFTDKVSHDARNIAVSTGRGAGIPVLMCHSCGVSSLKRCLEGIIKQTPVCFNQGHEKGRVQ